MFAVARLASYVSPTGLIPGANHVHCSAARQASIRALSTMSAAEQRIYDKLVSHFNASKVVVEDQSGSIANGYAHWAHASGGCGEKYAVLIVSQQFAGLSMLKQHKLVTAALKDEIAIMHALRIFTQEKEENE